MVWSGVYRGVVLTTSDPTGAGRVRLQVPQVSGAAATDWVPAVQSGGALPAVGEAVWVMYQGGDASYPAYVPPISPPPPPPPPTVPLYPMVTEQVAEPDYATTGVYVPYTSAEWPSISFTVPPSGLFYVTVSGRVRNLASATATAWQTWQISGDYTLAVDAKWGVTCMGDARLQSSRRHLVTAVPAGAAITVVPCWNVSSYTAGSTQVVFGELIVEPVGNVV